MASSAVELAQAISQRSSFLMKWVSPILQAGWASTIAIRGRDFETEFVATVSVTTFFLFFGIRTEG